jgi:DNA-binding PadR family transcriptional regulator
MKKTDISLLSYALLGLIQQAPCSGYDLRKMFALTPMQSFSDSPGAIYPALGRLERKRLIRGSVEGRSGLRRRKVFGLTPAGLAALKHWLSGPVRHEEVVREWGGLMLRFAFTDDVLGKGTGKAFLTALVKKLEPYILSLREYLVAQRANMPTSGRLALESGVEGYEAQLQWARAALETYEKEQQSRRQS